MVSTRLVVENVDRAVSDLQDIDVAGEGDSGFDWYLKDRRQTADSANAGGSSSALWDADTDTRLMAVNLVAPEASGRETLGEGELLGSWPPRCSVVLRHPNRAKKYLARALAHCRKSAMVEAVG